MSTTEAQERLQHVTIEAGTNQRLFSATYACPLKIYVKDVLIYDSELEANYRYDTSLPPI